MYIRRKAFSTRETELEQKNSDVNSKEEKKSSKLDPSIPIGAGGFLGAGITAAVLDSKKPIEVIGPSGHEITAEGVKNLGHLEMELDKGPVKAIKKLSPKELKLGHFLGLHASAIGAGALSGRNAAKAEAEGRKESKLNRNMGWIAPTALIAPYLITEGLAARKGFKAVKDWGLSKEAMSGIKKNMTNDFLKNAALAGTFAGESELARGISKSIYRKKYAKDKDKNNK